MSINIRNYKIDIESINKFYIIDKKEKNDKNNKIREVVIEAIINDDIPNEYYIISSKWQKLKASLYKYINILSDNIKIETIKCINKGGRIYHYDFEILINGIHVYKIEFKFNVAKCKDTPQVVSPMKPSQYMNNDYEEYYYEKFLRRISTKYNLPLPDKDEYLKTIHQMNPKCMKLYKEKYKTDKEFNIYVNKLSRKSLTLFITQVSLKKNRLSNYLKETQKGKIYMLYKDGKFYMEKINLKNYSIVSYEKDSRHTRYIATAKTGLKLKILLRWKNCNGIAYPAFQISV
jgi:hypothetical protein